MTPPPIAVMSCDRPAMLYRVLQSLREQTGGVEGSRVSLFQDVMPSASAEDVAAAGACNEIFHSLLLGM